MKYDAEIAFEESCKDELAGTGRKEIVERELHVLFDCTLNKEPNQILFLKKKFRKAGFSNWCGVVVVVAKPGRDMCI